MNVSAPENASESNFLVYDLLSARLLYFCVFKRKRSNRFYGGGQVGAGQFGYKPYKVESKTEYFFVEMLFFTSKPEFSKKITLLCFYVFYIKS